MNQFQTDPSFRFSQTLEDVRALIERAPRKVPLREVISYFGPKGHALLSLFFVLPFLQPIPIPGLSCVLGACICFFGAFMALNKAPWIPEWAAKIEVEKKFLLVVTGALESLLKKVERFTHPRRTALVRQPKLRTVNGIILTWHAFLLALPLPVPFSNILPAFCLALIALGSLEEDFSVIASGYVMAIVNAIFFIGVAWAPFAFHHALQHG